MSESKKEIEKLKKQLRSYKKRLKIAEKSLEENAVDFSREMEIALDNVIKHNEIQRQFLANMSHEIRTPLNGMLGLTYLLQNTKLDEQQSKYLNLIIDSGESLASALCDILEYTKIESGNLSLLKSKIDFVKMLKGVIGNISKLIRGKDIDFIVNLSEDVPEFIEGDEEKIKQILMNILSNAVKFTHSGYVVLEVKFINENEKKIEFIIKDTGIGMSKEFKKKAFDIFTQSDMSDTRPFGGTGLGLSIVKEYTALMDGKISMESTIGKGTKFKFTLPLVNFIPRVQENIRAINKENTFVFCLYTHSFQKKILTSYFKKWNYKCFFSNEVEGLLKKILDNRKEEKNIVIYVPFSCKKIQEDLNLLLLLKKHSHQLIFERPLLPKLQNDHKIDLVRYPLLPHSLKFMLTSGLCKEKEVREIQSHLKGIQVLYVEDSKINQFLVKTALESYGLVCDIAVNGLEGVNLSKNKKYSIILMDYQMPVMDGVHATEIIRSDDWNLNQETPIYALTADTSDETKKKCLESGMNDYFTKPLDVKKLVENIEKRVSYKASA